MSNSYLLGSNVGEYRLVDFLGAGGMGEVYRGVHMKIGRVAAIKVLTQAARSDPGFVERFFNEARIQASLQHPNIATLYDFMEFRGQPCIIMEYVDGQTLCDTIRPRGPLPLDDTLRVFEAVVEAIAYIHGHGVIHRDIKSNNIKISSTGLVKLLDFGIAKGRMSPGLTETGSVIGTLEYISPEQLTAGVADARSDIWSLGVLLYEMTTGRVPFDAQTIGALCERISRGDYAPPAQLNPAVPQEVASVISRCLRKNPAERYQTAQALLEDVRRVRASYVARGLRPLRSTAPSPSAAGVVPGWLKLGGVAALAAALLLFAAVGVYLAASGGDGEGQPTAPAASGAAASNAAAPRGLKVVKIEMSDGPAQIWHGEELLGTMKATDLRARVGERVTLTLKRDGYEPKVVSFDVTENRTVYTFKMDK